MVPISVVSLSSCVIHARSLDLCLDFLTYNKMGLLGMGWLGGQIESISAKHLKLYI